MKEKIGDVTVALCLNPRPLKSGNYPVYVRIQKGNLNRYFSSRCEMSEKEWEAFSKVPDSEHPVMHFYRKCTDAVRKLVRNDDFSFNGLSRFIGRGESDTIQELISKRAEKFLLEKKHNSAGIYKNLLSSLNEFLEGEKIPVSRFTGDMCQGFSDWLMDVKGNSVSTVGIKLRSLNAVFNDALRLHLIVSNPMDGVKKPSGTKRYLYVSQESLSLLLEAGKEELGEEYPWLCIWRAVYYGNGMNVGDLLRLRPGNVHVSLSEITFTRRKTESSGKGPIHVPLIPELLSSLSVLPPGVEHLLSYLDGYRPGTREEYRRIRQIIKTTNKHLRRVTRILGIPEVITTGTARHCFATVLMQNNVPIEYISSALGHSSIRTTQHYLDGYTGEQRRIFSSLLHSGSES